MECGDRETNGVRQICGKPLGVQTVNSSGTRRRINAWLEC